MEMKPSALPRQTAKRGKKKPAQGNDPVWR
jgi:hypothetical protein